MELGEVRRAGGRLEEREGEREREGVRLTCLGHGACLPHLWGVCLVQEAVDDVREDGAGRLWEVGPQALRGHPVHLDMLWRGGKGEG